MTDPWRKAWLDLVDEPVLEPERPIVDPHHHLWGSRPNVPGPYLAPEFAADAASGHRIAKTVFVECGAGYRTTGPRHLAPVGETAFVVEEAERLAVQGGPPVAGIIAAAESCAAADFAPLLDAHEDAGQGRFRGVRLRYAVDPRGVLSGFSFLGPEGYADPACRAAAALLGRRGLILEAWLYHPQIANLTTLARACPETQIVLDHYGGPIGIGAYASRRAEVFAQWRADIAVLAQCPNVVVKLGGIAMPLNGFGWHDCARPPTSEELAAAQRPYFDCALEAFGPKRAMFESNFPVEKGSVSYRVLWNAFKRLAASCSAEEKDALFRTTALRVYKLPE